MISILRKVLLISSIIMAVAAVNSYSVDSLKILPVGNWGGTGLNHLVIHSYNNHDYLITELGMSLLVYDISNPLLPKMAGKCVLNEKIQTIIINNKSVFVVTESKGMSTLNNLDLSIPQRPLLRNMWASFQGKVCASDSKVYIIKTSKNQINEISILQIDDKNTFSNYSSNSIKPLDTYGSISFSATDNNLYIHQRISNSKGMFFNYAVTPELSLTLIDSMQTDDIFCNSDPYYSPSMFYIKDSSIIFGTNFHSPESKFSWCLSLLNLKNSIFQSLVSILKSIDSSSTSSNVLNVNGSRIVVSANDSIFLFEKIPGNKVLERVSCKNEMPERIVSITNWKNFIFTSDRRGINIFEFDSLKYGSLKRLSSIPVNNESVFDVQVNENRACVFTDSKISYLDISNSRNITEIAACSITHFSPDNFWDAAYSNFNKFYSAFSKSKILYFSNDSSIISLVDFSHEKNAQLKTFDLKLNRAGEVELIQNDTILCVGDQQGIRFYNVSDINEINLVSSFLFTTKHYEKYFFAFNDTICYTATKGMLYILNIKDLKSLKVINQIPLIDNNDSIEVFNIAHRDIFLYIRSFSLYTISVANPVSPILLSKNDITSNFQSANHDLIVNDSSIIIEGPSIAYFQAWQKNSDWITKFNFFNSNKTILQNNIAYMASCDNGLIISLHNIPELQPLITITSPHDGYNSYLGDTIKIFTKIIRGAVKTVLLYNKDKFIAKDSIAPYEFSWVPLTAGTQNLSVVALFSDGTTRVSPIININVDATTDVRLRSFAIAKKIGVTNNGKFLIVKSQMPISGILSITNILGRKVAQIQIANEKEISISLSKFSHGIYGLTLQTHNGIIKKSFCK